MIWGLIPNIVYQFSTESRRKSTAIARGQIVPDPVYQKLVEKVDFVLLKYLTGLVRNDPSAYHVARLRHHPVTLGYTCSIRPIEKGS
jgi:hypothetical protein